MKNRKDLKDHSRKNQHKKAKRICIVRNKPYPVSPNRRNAETLVANGYDVDIICMKKKGEKSQETVGEIKLYRLPLEPRRGSGLRYIFEFFTFFIMASWKLTWLNLKRRYQVIEVSGIPDFMVFIAIVPKLMGSSVILNFLDHTADYFEEKYSVSSKHIVVRLLRFFEKTSGRWADHVFCTQIVTKELLVSRGVPESKISVVLNVPDETIFDRRVTIHNHKDNGKFRLITHGSLLEIYGIQTLIKAVPLLIIEIPNLEVKVVGDGEYRPYLEQLAQSLKISKYIDFTGMVTQEEVREHIIQSDIGVVAVHCKFPALSNKIFEYLAMGLPAVVTSISANKAYFDESSVKFFEPDNELELAHCILKLYQNPDKRIALAAAGSATYQKYRWEIMKEGYLKVFEKLS